MIRKIFNDSVPFFLLKCVMLGSFLSLCFIFNNTCFAFQTRGSEKITSPWGDVFVGTRVSINGGEKIKSPWGEREHGYLFLNDPQNLSMVNNVLKIMAGLSYMDEKSAKYIDGGLNFSSFYVAKSPMSIKLFQAQDSKKWCATDGILGIDNDNSVVFEGLKIIVIGGSSNPIRIAGVPCSDTIIVIKNGKPFKIDK